MDGEIFFLKTGNVGNKKKYFFEDSKRLTEPL
jgi:hypothetical protein